MSDNKKAYSEAKSIADLLDIKIAPIEQVLAVYPDSFLGFDFEEEVRNQAKNARQKYSNYTIEKLISSFRSHEWKRRSDAYGHNGLSGEFTCLRCKMCVELPRVRSLNSVKTEYSDDFILAYHYVYGHQKRFGGRITKCKAEK